MSCEELPSNLVPIKDVSVEEVERVGWFAVEEHNKNDGHHFIYKRVVNGLYSPIIGLGPKYYIIVIEAINDLGFHLSYIAKVKKLDCIHMMWPGPPSEKLLSFEEVIEFPDLK